MNVNVDEDLEAGLEAAPWLRLYMEPGDRTLAPARLRRLQVQEAFLRRAGDVPHRAHRGDVIFTAVDGPAGEDEP